MLPWIQQLNERMKQVDTRPLLEQLELGAKLQPHEHIVGKLSDEMLRLFGVVLAQGMEMISHMGRCADLFDRLPEMESELEIEARIRPLMSEGAELSRRLQLTEDLFWASIIFEFPEAANRNRGIRAGGRVVVWETEADPRRMRQQMAAGELAAIISKLEQIHLRN
ncbi:hypothetical protein HYV30_00590 [Candidatus Kaiserbacteria bacterium]|nr:hypothetical protein [Candidatus Kaiserbacteria bacterium]